MGGENQDRGVVCPLGIEDNSPLLDDCPDIFCPLYRDCKEWNERKKTIYMKRSK